MKLNINMDSSSFTTEFQVGTNFSWDFIKCPKLGALNPISSGISWGLKLQICCRRSLFESYWMALHAWFSFWGCWFHKFFLFTCVSLIIVLELLSLYIWLHFLGSVSILPLPSVGINMLSQLPVSYFSLIKFSCLHKHIWSSGLLSNPYSKLNLLSIDE